MTQPLHRPRPVDEADDRSTFACGVAVLDDWLRLHALESHRSGMSRVFVTTRGPYRVVGYYGLASIGIEHASATRRVGRGMPRHPIPALLITRLATCRSEQGHGLGRALVRDAMIRAVRVAEQVGVRALHAQAKSDVARAFYVGLGFEPSPADPLHLQVTMKTIRASLAAAGEALPEWQR